MRKKKCEITCDPSVLSNACNFSEGDQSVARVARAGFASKVGRILAVLVPACCAISSAYAQDADTQSSADAQGTADAQSSADTKSKADEPIAEIVVTGTLLRGAAPVGSNLISVGKDNVTSTGSTSTNQLLSSIPQVVNFFNTVPNVGLGNPNAVQVARPNLRNLPGGSLATGAATLILIDGHRVAGVGVNQSAVDADLVPTGAIERVEIITDGGSSTYGADAVGGVINFITRKRFDGVQVGARTGFADNYSTYDANVIAGKDWGSGSIYGSYSYSKNDALFGRDRDFVKRLDYSMDPPVPASGQCTNGNVSAGGVNYALPNLVANTFNYCDPSADGTILPSSERQGVFAGFSQNLSDTVSVDARAFYSKRDTGSQGGPLAATVNMGPSNPYYTAVGDDTTAIQQVSFNFAPVLGNASAPSSTHFDEKGISAELSADLMGGWQLRTLFNYSDSSSTYHLRQPNAARLNAAAAGTSTDTAINPYDIAATQNLQLISDITNDEIAGESGDELFNVRSIADGSLATLQGGDVRLALGYEFSSDNFKQRYGEVDIGGLDAQPFQTYIRDVHSGFGELQVPIFGQGNAVTGIHSLVLSASARYDHYSDFGDTFNPKFGMNYSPVEWVSFHGNWGKSFNAPTPVDQLGSQRNVIQAFPFTAAPAPGDSFQFGQYTLAALGATADLKPQTAKTWSTGFDVKFPFAPGLRSSISYYNIFFKGTLSNPPVQDTQLLFQNFSQVVTLHPTAEQIAAFGNLAPNSGGPAVVAPFVDGSQPVYELIDFRTNNFGNTKLSGLDFSTSYFYPTGFGSIDATVSGNYQLSRKTQPAAGASFNNDLNYGISRLQVQTKIGADIYNFRAQATWNHSAGYDVLRASNLPQDHVSSFDTVNLFFRYDVNGEEMLKDLEFTLNVDNVLDQDPPEYRLSGTGNGYTNGFTVGRMFMLGVSKKF